MQEQEERELDRKIFCELAKKEDLAEKKAKIYSRLLTEVSLATEMETLAVRHAERKELLLNFAGKKGEKK